MHVQAVVKGKKRAKATVNKHKHPFVLSNEQQKQVAQTLSSIRDEGHIPIGWSTLNLQHCFEHPSYLKAHDWLLLAGPIGKYVLQVHLLQVLMKWGCT